MNYSQYQQLAKNEAAKGRKYLFTTYFFIAISLVFFALFFFNTQELPVIGCAFLCDAVAVVYLFRTLNLTFPFWQGILARRCAAEPSQKAIYELCAALELPKQPCKYGATIQSAFSAACSTVSAREDISDSDKAMLRSHLKSYAGMEL